jgi:gas vesicle protein
MRKKSMSIVALFLGAAVGIIGGVLFAPARGTSVRSVLSYKIRSYIEKLQDLVKTLSYTKTAVSSQAKATGQEVIDETIIKAKQLLQEANELAAQLEE